jgi:hypothetical protein
MFNSVVLDVFIGLIFIYLLYSLLATIIQELIATWFDFRSKILERAIFRMLEDEDKFKYSISSVFYLFRKTGNGGTQNSTSFGFYNHPLIKFLGDSKNKSKPSYISKETFSKVIIDLLRGDQVKPGDNVVLLIHNALNDKKINVKWGTFSAKIGDQTLSYINSLWADSLGDVEKFKEHLENWFDETMERASGWFKKKTQLILFLIGLALAISFNIDTISIGGILSKDPKLAAQLADNASVYVQNHKEIGSQMQAEPEIAADKTKILNIDNQLKTTINKSDSLMNKANALIRGEIADTNKLLGLGWSGSDNFHWWSIIGWIITALAISLGAPFWFDLLNKLMQLRSSKKQDSDSSIKTSEKTIPATININTQTSEEAVG